jgi:hypothetical protein
VTAPGVWLSAACFPELRFEDDNFGDCLSNLLAVGFRRFEIDIYWDEGRQVWSFCPVAIPTSIPRAAPAATATLSFNSTSSSAVMYGAAPSAFSSFSSSRSSSSSTRVTAKQATSDQTSISIPQKSPIITSESAVETSLGESLPSSIAVLPNTSNEPLVSIGPFVCTTTVNLSTFITQLLDYIQKSQNTIGAHIMIINFNIHAAANASTPTSPAPEPSLLPQTTSLLSDLFKANLSEYIYTPSNLESDREDLNESWFNVDPRYQPVEDYYLMQADNHGIVSTEDGWPSESYIEFSRSKRLLLGFGNVDPQMYMYNFTGDYDTIFREGFTQKDQSDVDVTSSGHITSGCFLHNDTVEVIQVNSSWATETTISGFDYSKFAFSDLSPLLSLTSNSTNCGISPVLNVTLLNSTAHDNYIPYQNYSYSTIWSWAPDQPQNYTSADSGTSDSLFRCATAIPTLGGRWGVADCSSKFFAACRAQNQPYNWTLTTYPISYFYADEACPSSYAFAAPRTALENSYLAQAMRNSRRDYDGHGAWVDFNSLDVKACWVMGGPNATCPYTDIGLEKQDYKQYVLVCLPPPSPISILLARRQC